MPPGKRPKIPVSESHPYLMREWDFHKNEEIGISPDERTYGSNTKVWWICSKCKGGWSTTICNRSSVRVGKGCPYCAGRRVESWNCLRNNDPRGICKEWHPDNELTPDQVTARSDKRVEWICSKGHTWHTTVRNRVRGTKCPFCSGRRVSNAYNLTSRDPFGICKQWHPDNELKPEQVTPFSAKKVKWICLEGHVWEARIGNRSDGNGCLRCFRDSLKRKINGLWDDDNEEEEW